MRTGPFEVRSRPGVRPPAPPDYASMPAGRYPWGGGSMPTISFVRLHLDAAGESHMLPGEVVLRQQSSPHRHSRWRSRRSSRLSGGDTSISRHGGSAIGTRTRSDLDLLFARADGVHGQRRRHSPCRAGQHDAPGGHGRSRPSQPRRGRQRRSARGGAAVRRSSCARTHAMGMRLTSRSGAPQPRPASPGGRRGRCDRWCTRPHDRLAALSNRTV